MGGPYLGHTCLPSVCCTLVLSSLVLTFPFKALLSRSLARSIPSGLLEPHLSCCQECSRAGGLSAAALQPLFSSEIMTSGWSSDRPGPLLSEPPHPLRLSFPSSSVPSLVLPWVHHNSPLWPCSPLPPSGPCPPEAMQRAGWVCCKEEVGMAPPSRAWGSKNVLV